MYKFKENKKKFTGYTIALDKLLSQHFIIDEKYLDLMARDVNGGDVVIEIGAGFGQLTSLLAKRALRVIAIEIDKRFKKYLYHKVGKLNNVEIIFEDALKVSLDEIIESKLTKSGKVWVIANLPYHITEPFFNKIIKYPNIKMRLMVGKKFGYLAQINDVKDVHFGSLSFLVSAFYKVKQMCIVPKYAFSPQPKTDSIILDFLPKEQNLENTSEYLIQGLFLYQKYGAKVKNALVNNIISFARLNGKFLTKNEARSKVLDLDLPSEILQKSFSQLNNRQVRYLAQRLSNSRLCRIS